MKGLLVVIVLLLAVAIGLGLYRGWFHFSTENTDEKPKVSLTVDEDKIHQDEEKVQDLGHKVKEKAGGRTDTAK